MGRRPQWGRAVNGVFVLDKPQGVSSNGALQQVKKLFFAKRAGHTGSLDPLATGVLPICLGEATKFSQFLLDADKAYQATFKFGIKTESGDSDGEVVEVNNASQVKALQVQALIPQFCGDIKQKPSIYSALKYQGKPFYQWAREGLELPEEARKIRDVRVYQYDLLCFREGEYPEIDVEVHCSKGTYIRSLAEDLGTLLGVGAHVTRLHRIKAGPFEISQAMRLDALQNARGDLDPDSLDALLHPTDMPVYSLPKISVSQDHCKAFGMGQCLSCDENYRLPPEDGMVRVFSDSGLFLGVAELKDTRLHPKRLVNY